MSIESEKQLKESENIITQNHNEEQISETPQIIDNYNEEQKTREQQEVGESQELELDGSPQRHRQQRIWDRQSITPSEVPDNKMTEEYILPFNGCQTVDDVMKAKRYEIHEKIGKGGFGTVYKAYKLNDFNNERKVMACKQINLDQTKREKIIRRLKTELYVLEKVKHQYIIELYDHFIVDNIAYIFMEFAEEKSLMHEISFGPLKDDLAKRYFAQIIIGLTHMHKHLVAHRDLKLENILLIKSKKNDGFKDVKISDFGLSQSAYKPKKGIIKSGHFGGTRYYMAPEIIKLDVYKGHKYDRALEYDPYKADMWALGVCLFQMLTKTLPFEISNPTKMLENQDTSNWKYPENLKNTIEPKADHLIKQLLQPDCNLRIDPFGVLTHQWLKQEIDPITSFEF